MAQQTAVEWFFMTMNIRGLLPNKEIVECYEQAKQMEKDQIVKSWDDGSETEYQYHVNGVFRRCSFDYYNETYGKN